jgi:hypothetical protein
MTPELLTSITVFWLSDEAPTPVVEVWTALCCATLFDVVLGSWLILAEYVEAVFC